MLSLQVLILLKRLLYAENPTATLCNHDRGRNKCA